MMMDSLLPFWVFRTYATCKEATAARRVHTRAVSVPRAAEILLIPHGRRDGNLP